MYRDPFPVPSSATGFSGIVSLERGSTSRVVAEDSREVNAGDAEVPHWILLEWLLELYDEDIWAEWESTRHVPIANGGWCDEPGLWCHECFFGRGFTCRFVAVQPYLDDVWVWVTKLEVFIDPDVLDNEEAALNQWIVEGIAREAREDKSERITTGEQLDDSTYLGGRFSASQGSSLQGALGKGKAPAN